MSYEIKNGSIKVASKGVRNMDLTAGERIVTYVVCIAGSPTGLCKTESCTISVSETDTLAGIQSAATSAANSDFATKYS